MMVAYCTRKNPGDKLLSKAEVVVNDDVIGVCKCTHFPRIIHIAQFRIHFRVSSNPEPEGPGTKNKHPAES